MPEIFKGLGDGGAARDARYEEATIQSSHIRNYVSDRRSFHRSKRTGNWERSARRGRRDFRCCSRWDGEWRRKVRERRCRGAVEGGATIADKKTRRR
jgi:hypothetical protein